MPTKIGPSFAEELRDAGLLSVPMVWSDAGEIRFDDDVPQSRRDSVLAVLATHDPERVHPKQELKKTDAQMPRALEDLLTLLLRKDIVRRAELPPSVMALLNQRRRQRGEEDA